MQGILNSFDLNADFWSVNPQFKVYFSDVYKKKDSSKMMWAIALLYDPKSIYRNLSFDDRRVVVSTLYDGQYEESAVEKYKSLVITPAQRQLNEWNRIMDDKSRLLSIMKYDISNWEVIEKMLGGNSKLYAELQRIQEVLNQEDGEGSVRGGSLESASESGII